MGGFHEALQDTLDAVVADADREEGAAPAPKQEVAPPAKAPAPVQKAAPTAAPMGRSQAAAPAKEIVMQPSPGNHPEAKWRKLMEKSEDRPDIELQRERRKHNQCPVCGTQAPKIGRTAMPQLHYCEECAFPFHVYAA